MASSLFCYLFLWVISTNELHANPVLNPLRDAASKRGMFIGTALRYSVLNSDADPEYKTTAAMQYNLVTAENACKWTATEPQQNTFNFKACDAVLQFAKTNNMTFRGHNLCWGNYNPSWLVNGTFTPSELQKVLKNHITKVVQHYGDDVYCWDVVNEAVSDNPSSDPGHSHLYKDTIWYPAIPNYVDIAFQTARSALDAQSTSSGVKLFYNDYNILLDTGFMAKKADAVYFMLKDMVQNGIPVDGVGMQAHLSIDDYEYITEGDRSIGSNIKRFVELGLEVHITEFDVACKKDIPCDQLQADMYQIVLDVCVAIKGCKSFETWGYTDKYSWRGVDEYPLPWNVTYQPKLAAYYMETALKPPPRSE